MKIVVERDESKWNMSDDHDIAITSVIGLTPIGGVIYTTPLSAGDGSTYNNARVEQRNIVFTLKPQCSAEKFRLKVYKYFMLKQNVILYFKTNARDVFISGYVESVDGNLYEQGQSLVVSVICHNPYFRDVTDSRITFASIVDMFEFPFAIEEEGIVFSDATATVEKSLINDGEDYAGMIIELEAIDKVVEPTIYNKTTREQFSLKFEMKSGDKITINTNKGQLAVTLLRNGVETNIMNKVYIGSKWIKLKPGDNLITYECAYGLDNLYVTLQTNNLYGGL